MTKIGEYAERFAKAALGQPVKKTAKAGNGLAAVAKADEELQVVWGEVYAPNFPDSQGDWMSAETIRKMAWEFIRAENVHKIDVQHNQKESGAYVVESFIAREDDAVFIPGSWVVGVHIPDPDLWALIKSGELNGFSLDGFAVKVASDVEVVVPNILTGRTDIVEDHDHVWYVEYDAATNTVKGETDVGPDGFKHIIRGATTTEMANGHKHKFSFVEGLIRAQS